MQKIIFLCLVALLALFQYQLKMNQGVETKVIQEQILEQKVINHKLEVRNQAITNQVMGLKGSNQTLEAKARMDLNLIAPNEMLLLFPGNTVTIKNNK